MYIRSFKPAGASGGGWVGRAVAHLLVFAATAVLSLYSLYHLVHAFLAGGAAWSTVTGFLTTDFASVLGALAGLGVLQWLGRAHGPVDFDARNADDVESMGLYWHFVDIVWIVIFTGVYLLEYVFPAAH
jgi:cytochrome o ubiquinol oxidase subunit 3